MSDQRTCRATGRLSCERASQHLREKRLRRCWYDQSIRGIQKIQERLSDCALGASRMRQHEWLKKEIWVGMNCGRKELKGLSAELEELTSISGDVHVRGTVKIVSFPTTRKTTTLADAIFVHTPHELWRLSRNCNSISASKSDVVSQCLDQSFSSPFALRIHPSSKDLRGGNIIGNAMVLSTPSTSFPTESHPSPGLVDDPKL